MNIESLENRLLLATGPMVFTSFDGVSKKLTVTTAALGVSNDIIVISVSAGNTLSVSVGGANDYNDAFANILSIVVSASSGNDSINLGTTTKPITVPTTLSGDNGDDTITGGQGNDSISGGNGNDSMDGGLGTDSLFGGANNDTVSYATRATAVNVTLDNVANDGTPGSEFDSVGSNFDVESIMGGSGNDTLTGSSAGNYISGGAGADLIHGMVGSDTMVGGAGSDFLYGDEDADFIFAKDGEFDTIDGGPGFDSADVDTSPVEAPLPGAPVPASTPVSSQAVEVPVNTEIVGATPKPASPFSTRRVPKRPANRTRARDRAIAAAVAGPVPAPPPGGYESKIDPATIQSLIQPLDPYCKGQVLVTRDGQGSVHADGTIGDDQFIVQTAPGLAGVNVTNNGGFTEWPLPSNPIFVNGQGGNDGLAVSGGNVSYSPGGQPGSGTITSDGHLIIFNGIAPNQISFNGVGNLTIVTPGSSDLIQLGAVGTTSSTQLDGQSGGLPLGPIILDNVQLLTLDFGTNDNATNPNDTMIVGNIPDGGPAVAIMPGLFGSDTVNVNGTGFVLANDPAPDPNQPTVTLNVTGAMTFTGPITHLAMLNLTGQATIASGGGKSVHPGGMNINGGTLNINDNSVLLDGPGGGPHIFMQTGGATKLGNATGGGTLSATTINLQGGRLAGIGGVGGSVINAATIAPGFSPGNITINGDYVQTQAGTLEIEVGGTTPGTDFDKLAVSGTANLDGVLSVSLINSFVPASSDLFTFLSFASHSGDFATKNGLSFTGGVFQPLISPIRYTLDTNLAPIAAPDSADLLEDHQVTINVLLNDSDPDDTDATPDVDPPTIDTFTQPGHGIVAPNGTGAFNYTPSPNFSGTDTFTYTLRDIAGNLATATVTLNVTPVNDPPSFSMPTSTPTINEDAGPQAVSGFASKIFPGPATATDEANQTLTFQLSLAAVPAGFFLTPPAIDASGKLTYTTAPDVNGSAMIAVRLQDSGGVAKGGNDLSPPQNFTITVNPVNDAPQFSLLTPSTTVNEDAGPQSIAIISTPPGPLPGPSTATDESNQTLHFVANTTSPSLFSILPFIDPANGHLTYTPAPDAHGTATIDVTLVDDGGVVNGGSDTSGVHSFTVTINPVPPTVLGALFIREAASNPFPGNYLVVRFSESTQQSLSLADVQVRNITLNQDLVPASLQYIAAVQTAIITLPAGYPPDGNYVLTLHSAGITDPGGTPLDGDGDGQGGGDFTFSFFQLLGDVNLDRSVGFPDLVAVAQNYGKTGQSYSDGDVNGDGEVGFPDLVAIAQNYGKSLIPPVPAASLPVAVAAPAPVPVVSLATVPAKHKASVFAVQPIVKKPPAAPPLRSKTLSRQIR